MFTRSERLFLRPAWVEDDQDLYKAIADEAVVGTLSQVPWPYTLEDAQGFIALPQDPFLPRFLITKPGAQGARVIGGCGLSLLGGDVNLGYWLASDQWGQGYATEAARGVLSIAEALGHKRIVARHYIDNAASGRVLQKVGFRSTGRVIEQFSKARGFASPTREYEIHLGSPDDCAGDDGVTSRWAA